MDQKGLMFVPHIMVVQQGTTVDFLNSDSVQHNVFWPSVGAIRKRPTISERGQKARSVPLHSTRRACACSGNVHPDMSAYIIVSPTPYFAESDDSGNYKIKTFPTAATP